MEQLEAMNEAQRDQCLLPVDLLLQKLPSVLLDDESAHSFRQGQPVWKSSVKESGLLRVYGPNGKLLGVAENLGDGRVAPRRVLSV
jgi:tRNA pseudouridine55 synthase